MPRSVSADLPVLGVAMLSDHLAEIDDRLVPCSAFPASRPSLQLNEGLESRDTDRDRRLGRVVVELARRCLACLPKWIAVVKPLTVANS